MSLTGKHQVVFILLEGDPSSPYLFLLVVEGFFSFIFNLNIVLVQFQVLLQCKVAQSLPTSYSRTTTLCFLKAFKQEYSILKYIFQKYEEASRAKINFSKSTMLFSPNMGKDRIIFLNSILGVQRVENLGTHLGLPSFFTKNKSNNFIFIIERTWKAVQGWKSSFTHRLARKFLSRV